MGASIARAMDRRAFVTGLGAVLAAPLGVEAEQARKVWRIGYLGGSPSVTAQFIDAFQQGLSEFGYVDGQNIAIEYRSDDGKPERLPALAAELVGLKVDVLVATTQPRAVAAKKATTTIPIVMVNVSHPIESGLVASLARPGGNVTGLTRVDADLTGKNLSLLAEAVPGLVRVAVLSNPTTPGYLTMVGVAKETARSLRLQLTIVEAGAPIELENAFVAMVRAHVNALLVLSDGMLWGERVRIADLALRHRLPSIFGNTEFAEVGGLMTYAPNSVAPYRRVAAYVDKILKGAKPGDLPVEQPTKFELVINLKTAKALGLTIPPSLLLRADQVIE
jgi:putative tryptophan/tyrosine transport system substrate-binding protein